MKNVGGVWLPDHETHMSEWMERVNQRVNGKLTYQLDKQILALDFVKQFRVAVDVGAHCGLWSMNLARRFMRVEAFEPVYEHRECFRKNVDMRNVVLHPTALGASDGFCDMHLVDGSSGAAWVEPNEKGEVLIQKLDSYDLQEVDFIKLDCEGYELFALQGAEKTLVRCKPVVCVEQKPDGAARFKTEQQSAVKYLECLGARLVAQKKGDFILTWEEK